MSKQTQKFFEQIKSGDPPSLAERVKEAAGTVRDIGGQLWDATKPMFDHGRTELAAALFAGHAHVMYMKGQEGAQLSTEQEHTRERAVERPEIQHGGREM